MIYLASPYSHADSAVQEARYQQALACTAALLNRKVFVYSPIAHCHELSVRHNLPGDFEFWMEYNFHMLERSEALYVLTIDGWPHSKGVKAEILFARKRMPIHFVNVAGEIS